MAELRTVETALHEADGKWLAGNAAQAAAAYERMLPSLPEEAAPFRATLVMRLARARLAAGDKSGALAALDRLKTMAYVPEHHALAAEELRAAIAGRPNPGLARTPIPPVGKAQATLRVDGGAKAGGNGSPARPFTRLEDAVAAAREVRKGGATGAIEIVLAPGRYRRTRTLELDGRDAGTADAPLVIRSREPGKPAILTGGTVLSQWSPVTDAEALAQLPEAAREKVRVCDLSAQGIEGLGELVLGGFSSARAHAVPGGTFPVPELFYRGEPQTLARWPNEGLTRLPVDEAPKTEADRFRRWAGEKDLWLYGYWHWDWADAYEKVASVEADGTIRLVPPVNTYGFRRRQGCAVNALCELDRPGEWVLDTAANRVFYLPPDGFDPAQCVLSTFGTILRARDCAHLQLRDVAIEYVRGDAVTFEDCPDLLVAGVSIENCSGLGIRIRGGERHLVHSCRIDGMGRGGIDLVAGDWQQLVPSHSVVENCRISRLSRIDRTYTPALRVEGMGFRIRHNAFTDIPSSAIRLETCDALVELNHFRHCVYESGDQGAIDMWGNPLYRGNLIRWNDFDHIVNPHAPYGAAAVRCDDYISGFMIERNVMRAGSPRGFGAVQFNQGTDNYVEGNLIVDWHRAFSGNSTAGEAWAKKITSHPRGKAALGETEWQGEAWRKKYPMVRDLMNGDDNHNYLVGNLLLGAGDWGAVGRSVSLGNRRGGSAVHAERLEELAAHVPPWYPIPLERIGPYSIAEAGPR